MCKKIILNSKYFFNEKVEIFKCYYLMLIKILKKEKKIFKLFI